MDKLVRRNSRSLTYPSSVIRLCGQEEITAILGAEILSGARKPGGRMPSDTEMFDTFGVSRVVTREVIKTLAAKGMVTSKMRVGTIVLDSSNWNWLDSDVLAWRVSVGLDFDFLKQLTEVRRAVEPAAAGLASIHRTSADLAKLRESVKAMGRAGNNRRQFVDADLQFHLAVSAASRNPFFHSFAALIETALFTMLSITATADSRKMQTDAAVTHGAIIAAIEAGDSELAADRMLQVVDEGLKHARRICKSG